MVSVQVIAKHFLVSLLTSALGHFELAASNFFSISMTGKFQNRLSQNWHGLIFNRRKIAVGVSHQVEWAWGKPPQSPS